jgi:hypothetical protein
MAWADDTQIKAALAAALKRADGGAGFPPYMDEQIAQATRKAQGQIRGVLTDLRRFSEAQLLAWSRLYEFHYDQSLFNCEVYLREAFKDTEGDLLRLKDRTAELLTVALGVDPDQPAVGVGPGLAGVMTFRKDFDDALARCRPWPGCY